MSGGVTKQSRVSKRELSTTGLLRAYTPPTRQLEITLNIFIITYNMIFKSYKFKTLISIFFLVTSSAFAQQTESQHTTVGFELDALPYITGGYYGSGWVGHNKMRYRVVVAKISVPDFAVPDGFTNNELQAYAAIVDYFLKPDFEKWWVGTGVEYWKGKIQSDAQLSTVAYDQTVFTLGGGYVWKFYKNFYLNPWAAVHLRIAGNTEVLVDGEEFKPSFFTPEASIKVGWHF